MGSTKGVIAGFVLAGCIGAWVWYVDARTLEPIYKQVVIEQVANGYTIDLCWKGAPCPANQQRRHIARDAQGAQAEVWQYLSGREERVNW